MYVETILNKCKNFKTLDVFSCILTFPFLYYSSIIPFEVLFRADYPSIEASYAKTEGILLSGNVITRKKHCNIITFLVP